MLEKVKCARRSIWYIIRFMLGWVVSLIIAASSVSSGFQRAQAYVESVPPAPARELIQCHNKEWETATLVNHSGALIHQKLAPFVEKMQLDAKRAGHVFTITSSYRTCDFQARLRARSCGTGEYNMLIKPIKECSPPTEPAGKSLHNEGLAVDFACQGYSYFQNSPCYNWLKARGFLYHLYEHQLEPWHWSTTGN